MADDRERLRATFDSATDDYQRARPEYPDALYDALIEAAQLSAGDRLLEVGCGTGRLGGRGDRGRLREGEPTGRRSVRPRVRGHDLALARPRDPLPTRGNSSSRADISPSGAPPTSSHRAGTRSSPSCKRSTRRSARACRRARGIHSRANCPTSARRSNVAGCSPTSPCATSTGKSSTTRTTTSDCSTPSPATSQ